MLLHAKPINILLATVIFFYTKLFQNQFFTNFFTKLYGSSKSYSGISVYRLIFQLSFFQHCIDLLGISTYQILDTNLKDRQLRSNRILTDKQQWLFNKKEKTTELIKRSNILYENLINKQRLHVQERSCRPMEERYKFTVTSRSGDNGQRYNRSDRIVSTYRSS